MSRLGEEAGGTLLKPTRRPFFRDAAITILIAFVLMEIMFHLGLTPSVTSLFRYPLNLILSSLILFFSFLGILGLLSNNSLAVYFAFLIPSWEFVLGAFSLARNLHEINQLTFLAQSFTSIILGVIGFWQVLCFYSSLRRERLATALGTRNDEYSNVEYAVELVNLIKNYFVGSIVVPAVNGLSLKVRQGEFISIMGPSGCGKSTLLNLIGALDKPTSGKVLIDGVDLSTLDEKALAILRNEKIGFVFQAYNLINRSSVFRNVELPMLVKSLSKEERAGRVLEMLKVVGISDKAYRKPKNLSGGEQQRVAIARALVNRPSIILADEPTGNLDSKAGEDIISFLRKMNKETGTTVIVVTHNRGVADMTDRIIHLRDGKISREELRHEESS